MAHWAPQAPQLFGSVCVSVHVPVHRVSVPVHPVTHVCVVAEHVGVALGQTMPQPPQLGDAAMFVSHPGSGSPAQCAHPAAHEETAHVPPLHCTPPTFFRAVQSWPHVPQFFSSVCVLAHPLAHDVVDGGHEHPPPPIVQTSLLGQAAQAAPFVPQLPPVCAAVTHPVLSQQPFAHEAALQATHVPAEQI
jgi:hypothetical protein